MREQALQLADQLEGVLAGFVSLEALLGEAARFGEPLGCCFHGLQHFLADADLRRRDAGYKAMQEAEMHKLIQLLRVGADAAALRGIDFLQVSR